MRSLSSVTTSYAINICEQMLIRSHSLIYDGGILGLRHVPAKKADKRQGTLFYMQRPNYFWVCLKLFSVCERIAYTLFLR